MNDIKIRKLKFFETAKLLKFRRENDYEAPAEKENAAEPLPLALLKALWYRKRMLNLIAEEKGKIVGYVCAVLGRHTQFKGNVHIVSAAVEKKLRSKGIGRMLFNQMESYARARNARRLELEVFDRNERAIKFYKELGYEVEGVKRYAVANESDHDNLVMMAKILGR